MTFRVLRGPNEVDDYRTLALETRLREREYVQRVLSTEPANLIGYWPMEEAVGLVAFDHSGNLNDGAYLAPTLGEPGIGDGGTSCLFTDLTTCLDVYSAGLAGAFDGAEWTFMHWVKVAAGVWPGLAFHVVGEFAADGNNYNGMWISNDGDGRLVLSTKAGGVGCVVNSTLNADVGWMCMVGVVSALANTVTLYKNGGVIGVPGVGMGAWAGALAANQTVVGAYNNAAAFSWKGHGAHAALWSKALTAPQVANLGIL